MTKQTLLILSLFCSLSFLIPNQAYCNTLEPDFYELFDGHGSVMLLINQETADIVYANNAAESFYGYSKSELESMKISDINTLTPAEVTEEMAAAVREERNFFIFKHRLADGSIKTVEVFSYPYTFGDTQMLFSVIHDISAEAALAEQNRQFSIALLGSLTLVIFSLLYFTLRLKKQNRLLAEQNNEISTFNELRQTFIDADYDIIYLKDENLNYLFVNQAFETFHRLEKGAIIGLDDYAINDSREFAELRRQTDLKVIETGQLVEDEVTWDGQTFRVTKFPIRLSNNNFGVGAYIRDITEEKQRENYRNHNLLRNSILVDVLSKPFADTEEQLRFTLDQCLKLTDSNHGFFAFHNPETDQVDITIWSGSVLQDCAVKHVTGMDHFNHQNVLAEVIASRKALMINDFTRANPLDIILDPDSGHVPLHNYLSVPVIFNNQVKAIVGMANSPNDYDENDVYQVTALMNGVWYAVERRKTEVKLAIERNKYLQTLISIGDGVIVVNKEGRVEILNTIAETLTGWTSGEAQGLHYKEVFRIAHENSEFEVNDPIGDALASGELQELHHKAILISREGLQYNLEDSAAPILDDSGNISGAVMVFRDITEKKAQLDKIEYLSYHDSLTALYNRRFFEEEMNRLDSKRNIPISIIMCDADNLKLVNDIFGHSEGDLMLKKIAETILNSCRSDDIIARWGGDEFVILLPQTNKTEAEAIKKRIVEGISAQNIKGLYFSLSIGIGTKTEARQSLWHTLETAEDNMYQEKMRLRKQADHSLIDSILATLHQTSVREKNHSEEVKDLCRDFAKQLDLSENQTIRLTEAAYLHDIGKVALDKLMLNKEGRLTNEEYEEMKTHPVNSYRILNILDSTVDLAEIALSHHERWDGKGYPKGLQGEEIPYLARIIAIVESYVAMVSSQSYKDPISREEALLELERSKGTQFAPTLVEAFIQMFS